MADLGRFDRRPPGAAAVARGVADMDAGAVRDVLHGPGAASYAQSIRGRMAMSGLYYLKGSPWVGDLLSELLSFPAGRHDDQVDALGLVGQLLDQMISGTAVRPIEKPKRDRYDRRRDDDDAGDGWKVV